MERNIDKFVVDNKSELPDGRTEFAVKCQSCGFTDCDCGMEPKERTDKSADAMSW